MERLHPSAAEFQETLPCLRGRVDFVTLVKTNCDVVVNVSPRQKQK